MKCNFCMCPEMRTIHKSDVGKVKKCLRCGLVQREFSKEPKNPYKNSHAMAVGNHQERLLRTVAYLRGKLPAKPLRVCDVGSGTGYFIKRLAGEPGYYTVCLEPSKGLIEELTKDMWKQCTVINASVSAISAFNQQFDLVTALGCHYLFRDHSKAIFDIYTALDDEGMFYMDGNVFEGMKGFVGEPLKPDEIWDHNKLVSFWFTPDLLHQQLSRWFDVLEVTQHDEKGSMVYGYLCRKRNAIGANNAQPV